MPYSWADYYNLHVGIQRHLVSLPLNKKLNIMTDKECLGPNQVYKGMLKKLKHEGLDRTEHKPGIAAEDFARFYESGTVLK